MAKAIAMKLDQTKAVYAFALFCAVSLIIVDLVSLLIGGVLRPLAPEW